MLGRAIVLLALLALLPAMDSTAVAAVAPVEVEACRVAPPTGGGEVSACVAAAVDPTQAPKNPRPTSSCLPPSSTKPVKCFVSADAGIVSASATLGAALP